MATDPIFAVIEAHRATVAAFEIADDDAKTAALSAAAALAAWAMLDCEPASMAGLVALLDYVNGVDPDTWPEAGDAPFVAEALRFAGKEAKRLSGLGGACPHCGAKGRGAAFSGCCGSPV